MLFIVCSQVVTDAGLPGGYALADIDSQEVKQAAAFAVREQSKMQGIALELERVVQAQQQVVAGMNYRLSLNVKRDGNSTTASALVFRGLDQHYELKHWEWIGQK